MGSEQPSEKKQQNSRSFKRGESKHQTHILAEQRQMTLKEQKKAQNEKNRKIAGYSLMAKKQMRK